MQTRFPITLTALVLAATVTSAGARQQAIIPAGTAIAIRTVDRVTSGGTASPMEYRASVDDAVIVNGVTVVPTGAAAYLQVVEAADAGAVRGRSSVTLRLVAVRVGRERLEFATSDPIKVESGSQAGQAAKSGGLGALIGGALGGLLGGKQGAKEGAAIGLAAGVTAAVVKGQEVRIPPETRMTFMVTQSSTTTEVADVDHELRAELLAIEDTGLTAVRTGDRGAFDALLSPDFVLIHNGKVVTRKSFIDQVKPQKNLIGAVIEDASVWRQGTQARLTGFQVSQHRDGKKVKILRQKFLDVFVAEEGRWRLRWSEVVDQ